MDHLKQHIGAANGPEENKEQCRYCIKTFPNAAAFAEHLSSIHPNQTKDGRGTYTFRCIICRVMKIQMFNFLKFLYFAAQIFN